MTMIDYKPGDLVSAQGREWVVLPKTTEDVVMVRPLGGVDDEITGLMPQLELVEPARFDLPDTENRGDLNACRLLRDAARLSTRAAAGPFRSFGRIAVEPRPYQLVPLLMAMKLDPVRMLVADDVGIGKTIESCLIAKELLDRGEADGLAIVCPPHLTEQWQRELNEKFHIECELVTRATANRLERGRSHAGESVFTRHKFVIVSIDYIKTPGRIDDFVQNCPSLVIVDEAHGCTLSGGRGSTGRQQRHQLVKRLLENQDRHAILVTATPHSGNEHAFASLVGLLDESFGVLTDEMPAKDRDALKKRLAKHLIQRKRKDVENYLGNTEFPTRYEDESLYSLTPAYRSLFEEVLGFAQELVTDDSGSKVHQRVRWWSALALLRALASSPAAAAATLRNRAANAEARNDQEADELGRRAILDEDDDGREEAFDLTPGGDAGDALSRNVKDRLRTLAEKADGLRGGEDAKLKQLTKDVKGLIKDGHQPIIFCRFIDTAEYVAEHLRASFKKAEVAAVTGNLPSREREDRINELSDAAQRILVCTDCLSEGVNLQEHFDAVIHYDLAWNPTRHEQREGRVDRYGQPCPDVKVLTLYGKDNLIDVVVLNVLHRKHKAIRSQLGISIAIPASTSEVVENLYDQVIRKLSGDQQMLLDYEWDGTEELHRNWQARAEKVSRSVFAQQTIEPTEVEAELQLVQQAIGTAPTVGRFLRDVFSQINLKTTDKGDERISVHLSDEAPRALRNAIGRDTAFDGRFVLPVKAPELYLARTHPVVEGLASWVLDTALDPMTAGRSGPIAKRCGVSQTRDVVERTCMLLLRIRHHLTIARRESSAPLLAEEILPIAYTGEATAPIWLEQKTVDALLVATPSGNVPSTLAKQQLDHFINEIPSLEPELDRIARDRAEAQRDAHERVRQSARQRGTVEVRPVLPVDVLGAFVLLPGGHG